VAKTIIHNVTSLLHTNTGRLHERSIYNNRNKWWQPGTANDSLQGAVTWQI